MHRKRGPENAQPLSNGHFRCMASSLNNKSFPEIGMPLHIANLPLYYSSHELIQKCKDVSYSISNRHL